jgi:signal transduction protein with GAF and PtsI domain
MDDPIGSLAQLLTDVILPNMKAVHASQAEQIAGNDRLEQAIEELQNHMRSQFALLDAQLTGCRAEIAALHAALEAAGAQRGAAGREQTGLVH